MKNLILIVFALIMSVPSLAGAQEDSLPWSSYEALIEHASEPRQLSEDERLERLAESKAELGRTSLVLRDAERALAMLERRMEIAHPEERSAIQRRIDGIERERAEARAERARAELRIERLSS
ncbi:MAG: hypothetical protein ACQEVA_06630 [Myxococcota bacterium]